ncbi:MAG: AMP-binding protein, partial [Nevskiales bacterium]
MNDTVPKAFAAAVRRHAGRIAVVGEEGEMLSFEQLDQLRLDAARALLALGVQPGERVGLWGQNCVEWIIAALAVH